MGLSIDGLQSSSSTLPKRNGIFISKSKVSGVKVFYDEKQPWQKRTDAIGIEMTLDIGKDFEPTFYVGGDYKRDEFGERINRGSLKKVDILFDALNIDAEIKEGGEIPEDVINDIVGREFVRLSYVKGLKPNGKTQWADWQETRPVGTDYNEFADAFLTAVEKGYVKNYDPQQDDELAL